MFSSADADAVVYEIRRALNLALKHWQGFLRKQFDLLAEDRIVFLVTHTKKEQSEWIVANHEAGEPLKLDEIMNQQHSENMDQLRT
jgi:hypothetical protein